MWELDYKESWVPKNWCFWTVVLEKTPQSPLDCKESQPAHPKGDRSWMFMGRTDVEAKTPYFGHLMRRTDSFEKTLMAGKDWEQEEKGMTEDEMVGWHHWLDGHEFEKAPGVSDEQGSLACCSPWGCKELDMTEQLNWMTNIRYCLESRKHLFNKTGQAEGTHVLCEYLFFYICFINRLSRFLKKKLIGLLLEIH